LARKNDGKGNGGTQQLPFECVALLLQGGGALGAYQGGVYQALAEADLHPNWVAGISIGGINAAIIAGNPPERRVERLRAFWDQVSTSPLGGWAGAGLGGGQPVGEIAHGLLDKINAVQTILAGSPGFFTPRFPPPWGFPPGSLAATSYYDTADLITTLENLADFDRINSGTTRLSVGAVNVRTGNFAYFDTTTDTIRPEHILASGALPPGFPAIEIDGEFYWDGGLVSNTPLQWVVDSRPRQDMLAFQVDLWSARGDFPKDLTDVSVRQKEIQFSSRTRASTDGLKELQKIRSTLCKFLKEVPDALLQTEEARILSEFADPKIYNIVQLIYRSKNYEGNSIDYEFSRLSMNDHWQAGYEDAVRALSHKEIFERPNIKQGFRAFDFTERGDEEKHRELSSTDMVTPTLVAAATSTGK
jgi:NTE family protein